MTDKILPDSYTLYPAHPNPFNPTTTIEYDLPEASRIALAIYDIVGREVISWRMVLDPGYKEVAWHGTDRKGRPVPSGVYIFRLEASSLESEAYFIASRKMVLMR